MKSEYKANSITLAGAIAMGTGVMIGAGIFALTGQIAQLAGPLFPLSFIAGALVTAFSAYTYVKMSNAYPSAGGIAMILQKAYGPTTIAAAAGVGQWPSAPRFSRGDSSTVSAQLWRSPATAG